MSERCWRHQFVAPPTTGGDAGSGTKGGKAPRAVSLGPPRRGGRVTFRSLREHVPFVTSDACPFRFRPARAARTPPDAPWSRPSAATSPSASTYPCAAADFDIHKLDALAD